MNCGTYMFLIALKPPLQDSKCVVKSLRRTWRRQFCRDLDDILQTHILGGPGVQCKIWATTRGKGHLVCKFDLKRP